MVSDQPSILPSAEPAPPPRAPGRPRNFACPNCGGAVTLRAAGQSITATCSQCSSVIDVADENLRIIEAAQSAMQQSDIPIGARARLKDIEWEVVGYMRRSDGPGDFRWTEHLLFNPYHGYRFLAEEYDHWTLVKMLNRDVPGAGREGWIDANGRSYQFFGRGFARTTYVAGEFFWRASTSDVTAVTDYIAPPYRLMVERNDEEIIVSEGEYLDARLVAAAFKLPLRVPSSSSAGVSQVNPYKPSFTIVALAVVAATMLQGTLLAISANALVNSQTYNLTAADKNKTLSSGTFRLNRSGNIEIETTSYLSNDWLELDMALVNIDTNQSYSVFQSLEHYSGTDSDGRWEEGGNSETSLLPPVPPGTYKLLIEPDAGLFSKPSSLLSSSAPLPAQPVTITIKYDVPVWSNYLIAMALLLAVPAISLIRRMMFEKSRWEKGGVAE
ncbi:MAG: DUF4178 domain-containing protein [Mesorhizobium sp.]|nr:DUF4178 domain-containing protein [Mesorhizobium sp. M4B.F.Ca.ET.058.02.1.1]RVC44926.1 DUF4178 domain-containing protein [Mesorhizobium sp. M4A.F.Ca.ET.090.04.2.1]RWC58522.1 MAG: DUF4178 domain-containing protein [Mesorhizobium sp.]RWD15873.1 MAG: DUF4178 domain-containing protein [Mesorhizobium sp.]RWD55193.1 MAG: DUF4178 domain-containing protein [Mesorhizobium sp.]